MLSCKVKNLFLIHISDEADFMPDLADFERKITKDTRAVIINNPNNPTGVVYSDVTLKEIARILTAKEEKFGTDIYLISDEPYRELVLSLIHI